MQCWFFHMAGHTASALVLFQLRRIDFRLACFNTSSWSVPLREAGGPQLMFWWQSEAAAPTLQRVFCENFWKREGCPSDSWHGRWHHASIPPGCVHITHLRGKVERRLAHIFAQTATKSTSLSFPLHIHRKMQTRGPTTCILRAHTHTLVQTLTRLVSTRMS